MEILKISDVFDYPPVDQQRLKKVMEKERRDKKKKIEQTEPEPGEKRKNGSIDKYA